MAMTFFEIERSRLDIDRAEDALGPHAVPSGRLRIIKDQSGSGRLQQEWTGLRGRGWFDVPSFTVEELP